MLLGRESPHRQQLADGLVMRTAATAEDVERVAAFNGVIHGAGLPPVIRSLFLHHPETTGRDLVFVEDERSGQVVSSLCVIPWTIRYEHVKLPAGEMGMVGTLESHRRRGLVRTQVGYFMQRLRERGCLLSHIQGIPYYYRQFGYEYAWPLEGGLRLTLREAPKPPEAAFRFRKATLADLPVLMRLYDEAAQDLAISAVRNEGIWRYLFGHTDGSEMECETVVIENAAGEIAGYMRLPASHFGDELTVSEASRLRHEAALAALAHLKTLAEERNKPGVRLNVAASSSLVQAARPLTVHDGHTYAWQICVPDMAALLRALAPVLERRIAGSPFAGLTQEIPLCLYRETIALRFSGGRLTEVANLGFQERGAICFPPLQFIPIALGYRSWDEQKRVYPDVSVAPAWRLLVQTLFPRVSAFLYTIY